MFAESYSIKFCGWFQNNFFSSLCLRHIADASARRPYLATRKPAPKWPETP